MESLGEYGGGVPPADPPAPRVTAPLLDSTLPLLVYSVPVCVCVCVCVSVCVCVCV
jgi:hypothetical protein